LDMIRNYFIIAVLIVVMLSVFNTLAGAGSDVPYEAPFEIYGVVKEVTPDGLDAFIPHINKQISVIVSSTTSIVDRMDKHAQPRLLSAINVDDLVVINGVVEKDAFSCRRISYLSMSK